MKGKSQGMNLQTESVKQLSEAILLLKDRDECFRFFQDLCTIKEIESLAQRFEVARLLNNGKKFHEIVQETGASTATIARVNRALMYGAGGYQLMLNRLDRNKSVNPGTDE